MNKTTSLWPMMAAVGIVTGIGMIGINPAAARAAGMAATITLSARQQGRLGLETVVLKSTFYKSTLSVPAVLARDPAAVQIISSPLAGRLVALRHRKMPSLLSTVSAGLMLARLEPALTATETTSLRLMLAKVHAKIASAKISAYTAQLELHRATALFKSNQAISEQSVENAKAAYALAKADYASDLVVQRSLKAWLSGKHSQRGIPVFSGAPGRVVRILAYPGQFVAAGAPLFTINNFRVLLVRIFLPPNYELPNHPELSMHINRHRYVLHSIGVAGRVARVTGGAVLLATFSTKQHLRPGMLARVLISTRPQHPRKGFLIPRRSIVWWGGARWIFVHPAASVFVPVRLSGARVMAGGRFTAQPHLGRSPVVVHGAQLLLSIEESSSLKKSG